MELYLDNLAQYQPGRQYGLYVLVARTKGVARLLTSRSKHRAEESLCDQNLFVNERLGSKDMTAAKSSVHEAPATNQAVNIEVSSAAVECSSGELSYNDQSELVPQFECLLLSPIVGNPGHFRRVGVVSIGPRQSSGSDHGLDMGPVLRGFARELCSHDIAEDLYESVDEDFMYTITLV